MKIIRSIILIFLASVFITSCYIDKGNYDYTEISDIEISGIETSYTKVSAVDTLKINPVIASSYGDNFEYTWVLFDSQVKGDTIGKEKNLKYFVTKGVGSYTIFFYAKSKSNGYFVHESTSLTVGTLFTRGHYILKEDASGNTDMDLLLDDGRLISNILLNTQGSALSGKPRSMGILYAKQFLDPDLLTKVNSHCLGIVTYNKKVSVLRASDMRQLFTHSTMFFEETDDTPYKFLTGSEANIYLSSNGSYASSVAYVGAPSTGKLGFPSGESGGSDFWALSPLLEGMVYWDETKSRFLWSNYIGDANVFTDDVHPTSNLNYECLFMGNYKNVVYSLFRDKSNSARLVLYRITTSSYSASPKVEKVVEIAPSSKMHDANLFASNQYTADILYFVNNNKLYYYDAVNNVEYELAAAGLPASETITFISNRQYTIGTPNFDYLTIGTYNNGTYKLYMYNMIGGLPNGAPVRTTSGTGKIKETHYLGTSYSDYDLLMGKRYSR